MSDKIDFLLDLDAEEFASKITDAVDKIKNLQSTLGKVAGVAGVVGAAFLAVKTSLDVAFEFEKLRSLEVQFENLARQAGVSGDEIFHGMQRASDGLVGGSESMELANKAMLQLGASSARIPEIMEIARKASIVFGGSIEDAFERITLALATGQTRQLKALGVTIDADKAYRDFAKSIGTVASALSEQGRIQAIAAVALPQLQEKVKNIDTTVKGSTDAWTRFKNAIGDTGEAIAISFGPSAGGAWQRTLTGLADAFNGLSYWISESFGKGAERSLYLRGEILRLENEIDRLANKDFTFLERILGTGAGKNAEDAISRATAKVAKLKAELDSIRPKEQESVTGANTDNTESLIDPEKEKLAAKSRLQIQQKFYSDLRVLREQNIAYNIQTEQSSVEVENNIMAQRTLAAEQLQQRLTDIKNTEGLNDTQRNDLRVAAHQEMSDKIAQIEESRTQRQLAALDRYQAASSSTSEGIARGFEAGSKRAQMAQSDFGAVGARVFNSFSNNATAAFVAFGAGQKSASEAAKGFLFGMLADEAFARGQIMFLSSIWPPNPAGLAGGAALMAFSGFLRSQAGGSGTQGSTAVTAGGGITDSASSTVSAPEVREERERKMLNIVINGSVFDSRETGMRIAEIIKETSDATDIRIT